MTEIPEVVFYRKMFEPYRIRENFKRYDFIIFLKKDLERTISNLILKPIHAYKSFLEKRQVNRECSGLYNTSYYRWETLYDFEKMRAKTERRISKILGEIPS